MKTLVPSLQFLTFLALYNLLLVSSLVSYACTPYKPPAECETGRYEVRFYDNPVNLSRSPGAVAVTECVKALPGRYYISQVSFHTSHRDEYFEDLEIPVKNVGVCKVK